MIRSMCEHPGKYVWPCLLLPLVARLAMGLLIPEERVWEPEHFCVRKPALDSNELFLDNGCSGGDNCVMDVMSLLRVGKLPQV